MTPEDYKVDEPIMMYTDLVNSRKTQVPFQYYDLPSCPVVRNSSTSMMMMEHIHKKKNNFGSRLQGGTKSYQMAPYPLFVLHNQTTCRPLCQVKIGGKKLRWMRKLVERQYRIHLTLDQLPVLMKSLEFNYAVRGFPVGFAAPPSYTGMAELEYYLYNHLKFTITYYEQPQEFDGIRITGFDVHPVSYQHVLDSHVPQEQPITTTTDTTTTSTTEEGSRSDKSSGNWVIPTCNGPNAGPVLNDPKTYLPLRTGPTGEDLTVVFSYEVKWEKRDLKWADRWDVYLIGSPDDDIHYFAIVNSLMIVLFLTGAIATIMIRTLRKDIAGYNEIQTLEEAQEETGWKLVHGDVFRPPHVSPMLLSVVVGTGAQLGTSFFWSMMCAMIGLVNPMNKGQTLTAIIFLYVLSGSVAGYVSARLYKFFSMERHAMRTMATTTANAMSAHANQQQHALSPTAFSWKRNAIFTAVALPGALVTMFLLLNIFLRLAGAATAVGLFTVIALFALWTCVSTPLVLLGSYVGFAAHVLEAPTKTNPIARMVPSNLPWYSRPPTSMMLGGILPFGSVCIELFFIMSALWLHQIYYVMGFLLAVLLILAATCAEVAVVMCYLQLCAEDHRWWWKSFWNCASAGVYLFLYSLWFLSTRLELVGVLPVVVYLTYMSMISVCFGLFCGSVGVIMCGWFTRTIYGALKVD
jgi:transmembrane 9 superfamily protein 2/4